MVCDLMFTVKVQSKTTIDSQLKYVNLVLWL